MRRAIGTVMVLAVMTAAGTRGQVGETPGDCSKRWGAPVSGQISSNGYGVLRFTASDMSIEMDFVAGVAQRAVYRAPDLGDEAVHRLLSANSRGRQWDAFQRPGRGAEEDGNRMWMRSDETTMAELAGGCLTVVGAGWHQHLANPPPPAMASEPATNGVPIATNTVPLPPPRDPLVGFWRAGGGGRPMTALHVRDNGDLSWIVFGENERSVSDVQWKCERAEGRAMYTLTWAPAGTATSAQPRTIGKCELVSPDRLQWRGESVRRDRAFPVPWGMETDMAFDRADAMPRWKPKVPAMLPAKGDSRQNALRLLGKPTGMMSSGGREILIYPWGNVWIGNGVVVRMEQGEQ